MGGIISVLMVYAWYGVVVESTNSSSNADKIEKTDGNLHYWISFVFKVFHESSVEGN